MGDEEAISVVAAVNLNVITEMNELALLQPFTPSQTRPTRRLAKGLKQEYQDGRWMVLDDTIFLVCPP